MYLALHPVVRVGVLSSTLIISKFGLTEATHLKRSPSNKGSLVHYTIITKLVFVIVVITGLKLNPFIS